MFLTVGILLLGFFWIQWNINRPFGPTTKEDYAKMAELDQKDREIYKNTNEGQLIAKQTMDSDHDGLTDFMEEYVYKTSSYLADTDSDGISDKTEIDQGTNPLCPEGKNCSAISDAAIDESRSGITPEALMQQPGMNSGAFVNSLSAGMSSPDLSAANLSAAEIRKLLIDSGVPAESLAGVDDATLLAMYNEALAKYLPGNTTGGSAGSINNNVPAFNVNSPEDLKKLTPDQVRELLRQAGIPEETLEAIDDITLMANLEATIKQLEESSGNVNKK